MAIEFPKGPSLGEIFLGSNNLYYRWDGEKWITLGSVNANEGQIWQRNDTTISPAIDGDDLDDIGSITAAGRGTFNGVVKTTDLFQVENPDYPQVRLQRTGSGSKTNVNWTSFLDDAGSYVIKNETDSINALKANKDGSAEFAGGGIILGSTGGGQFNQRVNIGATLASGATPAATFGPSNNTIIFADGSATFMGGKCILGVSGNSGYKFGGMGSGTGQTVKYNTSTGVLSYDSSSARYKDNIRDDDVGLDVVMQLRPVKFEYKTDGRTDIGFIAEEMAELIPELVFNDESGKPEGIAYDRVCAVLTKALQESVTRIEALEERINQLEANK